MLFLSFELLVNQFSRFSLHWLAAFSLLFERNIWHSTWGRKVTREEMGNSEHKFSAPQLAVSRGSAVQSTPGVHKWRTFPPSCCHQGTFDTTWSCWDSDFTQCLDMCVVFHGGKKNLWLVWMLLADTVGGKRLNTDLKCLWLQLPDNRWEMIDLFRVSVASLNLKKKKQHFSVVALKWFSRREDSGGVEVSFQWTQMKYVSACSDSDMFTPLWW